MRRGHFAVLALFISATMPSGQADAQAVVGLRPDLIRVGPDDVVERLLSFDRNSDGKVGKDELAERMRHLVSRGDTDGDDALDPTELRRLATAPLAQREKMSFGRYGFADESSLSSRSHVEGAIEDLRLASPLKQQASAIATAYLDAHESSAVSELLTAVDGALSVQQLADFTSALSATSPIRRTSPAGVRELLFFVHAPALNAERRLVSYLLAPAASAQANAALSAYKSRLRLRDRERSELLAELSSILDQETLGNLRAALERRPVVAKGGGGTARRLDLRRDRRQCRRRWRPGPASRPADASHGLRDGSHRLAASVAWRYSGMSVVRSERPLTAWRTAG